MPPHSLPPTKKRKIAHDPGFTEQIKTLEAGLNEAINNNGSLNALADLLNVVQSTKGPLQVTKAIYAVYRVFVVIMTKGKLGLGGDEAAKLVKTWLLGQLDTYVDFLATLLKDEEKTLRVSYITSKLLLVPRLNHLPQDLGNSDSVVFAEAPLHLVLNTGIFPFLETSTPVSPITFP